MKYRALPALSLLRAKLSYNPDTGEFYWLVKPNRNHPVGVAGSKRNHKGFPRWSINFEGHRYLRSRLAWYFMTEQDPLDSVVDHKNRDSLDDRFVNLRLTNQSIDVANRVCKSKSGYKCISRRPQGNYMVIIKGRSYGTFNNIDEAIVKRDEIRSMMYGNTTTEGKLK